MALWAIYKCTRCGGVKSIVARRETGEEAERLIKNTNHNSPIRYIDCKSPPDEIKHCTCKKHRVIHADRHGIRKEDK
jgi:hypothetical protein